MKVRIVKRKIKQTQAKINKAYKLVLRAEEEIGNLYDYISESKDKKERVCCKDLDDIWRKVQVNTFALGDIALAGRRAADRCLKLRDLVIRF